MATRASGHVSSSSEHPRLFFTRADLPELQARGRTGVHRVILEHMKLNAGRRWNMELWEPVLVPPGRSLIRRRDGRQDSDSNYLRAYVDQYRAAQMVRNHAEFFSLLFLLTEESRYLAKAKEWALGPCRWAEETWGAYSPAKAPMSEYAQDNLIGMESSGGAVVDTVKDPTTGVIFPVFQDTGIFTSFKLRGMAIAYDWLHPHLTDSERELLRGTLIREAGRLYRHVREGKAMLIHRMLNHTWFDVSQFGITAAALCDDHPPAREWLEFARDQFVDRLLPKTLGRDGEFPEAGAYVQEYALMNAGLFFEALRAVTGEDLFAKPPFSTTAEFLLNAWSPTDGTGFDDDMTGFDLAEGMIYGFRPLMMRFASRLRNPHYQWYALHEGMAEPGSDAGKRYPGAKLYPVEREYPAAWEYLWYDPSVRARPPSKLRASAHLRDIGWVALRSGWEQESCFLMLRGGTSVGPHDRLDQGKFILYAKGERLAEHNYGPNYIHFEHFKYTPGSNTILVNGLGQEVTESYGHARFEKEYKSDAAPGRIAHFETHREYDYAVADATRAYGTRLSRFVRHVVFLKPDIFLLLDEIEAPEPVGIDWLFHSEGRLNVEANVITAAKPRARLEAVVLWPEGAKFEIRKSPPDYHDEDAPYLAVTPVAKTKAVRYLVAMWPLRPDERRGAVSARERDGVVELDVARGEEKWRLLLDTGRAKLEVSR